MSALIESDNDERAKRRQMVLGITITSVITLLFLAAIVTIVWRVIAANADRKKYNAACSLSLAFEHALQNGCIADAYCMTTPRFQQQTSLGNFIELINRYPALRGPEEAPYHYEGKMDHEFGSDQFTFKTEVSNHGHIAMLIYVIVKNVRQWKVDSVSFH